MKYALLALGFGIASLGNAFADKPALCYNPETKTQMLGYPKPHDANKGWCIASASRLPVEKVSLEGNILTVKNFTHGFRLQYAKLDLSKVKEAYFQALHFAPVVGDHAQLRIRFSTPNSIRVYRTLADLKAEQPTDTSDEMILSIEGTPLVGREYTFQAAIKHQLTMVYHMASIEEKKHYAIQNNYPVRQWRMNFPLSYYRKFIVAFVAKSEEVGFRSVYDLTKSNCGTETMKLMRALSASEPRYPQFSKNDVLRATFPKSIADVLEKKGLLKYSGDLPLMNDDPSVARYSVDFFKIADAEYDERSRQEKAGEFIPQP